MKKDSKIYVSGYTGLAGSAILRELKRRGFKNIITENSKKLDLRDEPKVSAFFKRTMPEYVFHAAARVGNMNSNIKYPAEFLYHNLLIQNNVIHNSFLSCVKRLIFFSSNCAYPKLCPQPMKEEYLFSGLIEPTNEAYGISKIAGIKMCESYNQQYGTKFLTVIPASIYGPGDHFDKERAHIIPSLIAKLHSAKLKKNPRINIGVNPNKSREFIFVDDLADGCIFLMNLKTFPKLPRSAINMGTGKSINMFHLGEKLKKAVGYEGDIIWNLKSPQGMPQKILNVNRINKLGWQNKINLGDGLSETYKWFLKNHVRN